MYHTNIETDVKAAGYSIYGNAGADPARGAKSGWDIFAGPLSSRLLCRCLYCPVHCSEKRVDATTIAEKLFH
jgi:hypothetical protein